MTEFGINLPWVQCGHDFGPSPPPWQGSPWQPADWSSVQGELSDLRLNAALKLTRFWLLAGGVNVPCGDNPLDYADLSSNGTGRRHALADAVSRRLGALARKTTSETYLGLVPHRPLPSLPSEFVEDFQGLLAACSRARVQAIPSLLSFEFFQPAIVRDDGVIQRGRKAFVFGRGPRDLGRFLDQTLEPLLEASEPWRNAVYAWELINEPGWAVQDGPVQLAPDYGYLPALRSVTAEQMCGLLREGVRRIVRRGFRATVGFADDRPKWLTRALFDELGRHAADGTYIHQRHHYPTLLHHRTLPAHSTMAIQPCFLGEVPTAIGGNSWMNARWQDPEVRSSERRTHTYLRERMRLIERRGYPAALLWSAHSDDPRKRWDSESASQVASFQHAGANSEEEPS